MEQLFCHLVGDYFLQSDYMANGKTKSHIPALCHALTYTLVFLFLTTSWKALLVIGTTHFLIDRFRLARYICWAKNWLAPWKSVPVDSSECVCSKCSDLKGKACCICGTTKLIPPVKSWKECSATGYDPETPIWLTTWLLIITDNAMHLIINWAALKWLG